MLCAACRVVESKSIYIFTCQGTLNNIKSKNHEWVHYMCWCVCACVCAMCSACHWWWRDGIWKPQKSHARRRHQRLFAKVHVANVVHTHTHTKVNLFICSTLTFQRASQCVCVYIIKKNVCEFLLNINKKGSLS